MLILEAQKNLLFILCDIVKQLGEGLEDTGIMVDGQNIIEIPKFEKKRSGDTELWSRFINQPFSEPPTFDIDHSTSIAQTKVNSFGDHPCYMQIDPGYLRRTIRNIIYAIPDRNSQTRSGETTYIIAFTEIEMDHGCCASWVWIFEEMKRVGELRLKYLDDIQGGKPPSDGISTGRSRAGTNRG